MIKLKEIVTYFNNRHNHVEFIGKNAMCFTYWLPLPEKPPITVLITFDSIKAYPMVTINIIFMDAHGLSRTELLETLNEEKIKSIGLPAYYENNQIATKHVFYNSISLTCKIVEWQLKKDIAELSMNIYPMFSKFR